MRQALGPWYRGRAVHFMTNDELVSCIRAAQRASAHIAIYEMTGGHTDVEHVHLSWSETNSSINIEAELARFIVERLRSYGQLGFGDAAARWCHPGYAELFTEAADRGLWDEIVEEKVHD